LNQRLEKHKCLKKKFDAGKKYIPDLFKEFDIPTDIDQIAVLAFASKQNRNTLAGGKIVLVKELLKEIFIGLKSGSIYSNRVPEQFPTLRTHQFVANYLK
jgi:hypothetical protein